MKKAVKTKWLNKLRSNEYEQARGALRMEVGYCCLGVLCEVHLQSQPIGGLIRWRPDAEIGAGRYSYRGEAYILPMIVRDYADIDSGHMQDLVDLNDNARADFLEIADWIEDNL